MTKRIGECTNLNDLVEALEDARQRRLELRRGFEVQWWENLAFIAGDHYVKYNAQTGEYTAPRPDPDKVRLVLNHAKTVYRTELARVTKTRPILEVMASSDNSEDVGAARVARRVLDAAEWKFKLRAKRKRAFGWMLATGLGSIYIGYDPTNDEDGQLEVIVDPTSNEITFSQQRIEELREMASRGEIEEPKVESWALGDLEFKVYSPMQLLPDETCLEFEDIKDLITTDVVDVDIAKAAWPKSAKDITPEDVHLGTMEARMIARSGLNPYSDATRAEFATKVHTFWLLPDIYVGNNFLKNGTMVRWSNGDVVLEHSEEFPFDDKRMPFAFFQHMPSELSIWPTCAITDIRDPNLELDRTMSQLLENRNYMSNPMWRVPHQADVRSRNIKMQPGGVLRYHAAPNLPGPEPVPGVPMPVQVENLAVALRDQILEISGQSEPSRGRVPPGVRSGVAVAYLIEEDETKIGPTIEGVEENTALMASLALARFGQFYTVSRLMRYYQEGGGLDVFRFKGADLRGITDVVPVAGSALPRSKAARQQFALQLAELGLETDPKRLRDMLELGRGEADDADLAIAQATRENTKMVGAVNIEANSDDRDPQAIAIKAWHNHQIHLVIHYRFMMTEEFERLYGENPDVVRLFDEHTNQHEQFLQAQREAQMRMLEAAKGAPSEAGGVTPNPEGRPDVIRGEEELARSAQ